MNSRQLISILSLLLLSLSVFGKSSTQNLRRSVSIDIDQAAIEDAIIENDKKKRLLVSKTASDNIIVKVIVKMFIKQNNIIFTSNQKEKVEKV